MIARPPQKKKDDQLPMCGQVGGWGRSQDRRVRSVHPVTRRKKTVRSNLIRLLLANENWCSVPLRCQTPVSCRCDVPSVSTAVRVSTDPRGSRCNTIVIGCSGSALNLRIPGLRAFNSQCILSIRITVLYKEYPGVEIRY